MKLNPKRLWGARTQKIALSGSPDNQMYIPFVEAQEYYFDPESNSNSQWIEISRETRFIKLTGFSNTGANAFQIAELEVY